MVRGACVRLRTSFFVDVAFLSSTKLSIIIMLLMLANYDVLVLKGIIVSGDVFEPAQISNRRYVSNVLFIFVIHFGGLVHDHLR
jgi:hypothetical protein